MMSERDTLPGLMKLTEASDHRQICMSRAQGQRIVHSLGTETIPLNRVQSHMRMFVRQGVDVDT